MQMVSVHIKEKEKLFVQMLVFVVLLLITVQIFPCTQI
jgi:hypothetical protein